MKEKEKSKFEQTYEHYYRLWESYQPMVVERFWQDLLQRTILSNKTEIAQRLAKQNIPYDETERYLAVLISIQRWHKPLSLREEKIMEYALRNSLEEVAFIREAGGQLIQVKSGALVAVVKAEAGGTRCSGRVNAELQAYMEACNRYFYCDLCCYVGTPVPIEELPAQYERLAEAEERNVTRTNEILYPHLLRRGGGKLQMPAMGGWGEMIKRGYIAELRADVEHYMEGLKRIEELDALQLRSFYEDFLQLVYHELHCKGLRAHQVLPEKLLSTRLKVITRSVDDLAQWVFAMIEEAGKHLHTPLENNSAAVVSKAKSYISLHLNQDISRNDIAGYVNLNPDYLTRIFKKETGLTISEYVLQERIRTAQEMLSKTGMPITEIAYAVGYNNYSHFSKMFKKATSMNPQEYRKSRQS